MVIRSLFTIFQNFKNIHITVFKWTNWNKQIGQFTDIKEMACFKLTSSQFGESCYYVRLFHSCSVILLEDWYQLPKQIKKCWFCIIGIYVCHIYLYITCIYICIFMSPCVYTCECIKRDNIGEEMTTMYRPHI